MPFFDLTTNVKDVPADFHKETTELVAQLLEKPSMVRNIYANFFVRVNALSSNLHGQ